MKRLPELWDWGYLCGSDLIKRHDSREGYYKIQIYISRDKITGIEYCNVWFCNDLEFLAEKYKERYPEPDNYDPDNREGAPFPYNVAADEVNEFKVHIDHFYDELRASVEFKKNLN